MNRIPVKQRPLSPGELSLQKRLAAYEQQRQSKLRRDYKASDKGFTIIRPSRQAIGDMTLWTPDN